MNEILRYLQKNKIPHFHDRHIKSHVTMNIGGRVKLLVTVEKDKHLRDLAVEIQKKKIPHVLIGGGSNVVFSDTYSPIVVIVNRTTGIALDDEYHLRVSSGVTNHDLIRWCKENGLSGLEFLAGVPGTIGGASAVNAGAFGTSLSDVLESARIIDEGGACHTVSHPFFRYQYRNSVFKMGNKIILTVSLRCRRADPVHISAQVNANLKYRKENHPPYSQFTAGCFFKNPLINRQRVSAGKLIEASRLKGMRFPHLQISDKHANFIVNTGKAGFQELRDLEKEICQRVMENTGNLLEREVIYITTGGKKT